MDDEETIGEWEERRRVQMDEVAVEAASIFRRWGITPGSDYESIDPSPDTMTLYVTGIRSETCAYVIALALAAAMPEDLRKIGLNHFEDQPSDFIVLACSSWSDLQTFCNRPLGLKSTGSRGNP